MSWAKLDDGFGTHTKTMEASNDELALHVVGLTYCAQHLTDGHITTAAARHLSALRNVGPETIAELVRIRMWDEAEGGYSTGGRGVIWDIGYTEKELHRFEKERRRARLKGVPHECVNRRLVIERDNSICYLCGRKLEPMEITLDHVIPLALGGPHTEAKMRVACRSCNSRKGRAVVAARRARFECGDDVI